MIRTCSLARMWETARKLWLSKATKPCQIAPCLYTLKSKCWMQVDVAILLLASSLHITKLQWSWGAQAPRQSCTLSCSALSSRPDWRVHARLLVVRTAHLSSLWQVYVQPGYHHRQDIHHQQKMKALLHKLHLVASVGHNACEHVQTFSGKFWVPPQWRHVQWRTR